VKLNRKQAAIVTDAITEWTQEGLVPAGQAAQLAASIEIQTFDWRRLAKYSFWVAAISIIISVSAVLSDESLVKLILKLFQAPDLVKCLGLSLVSTGLYRWGMHRRSTDPGYVYRNETIFFLGVLATAGAIVQFGKAIEADSAHVSLLILFSMLVYGVLAFVVESDLIWIFALASLGGWMGTETGYRSGWGAYYLGMNYPLRFVLFGGLLTVSSLALEHHPMLGRFFRSTLAMGMLYLFIALWILSIFGNYRDLLQWEKVKQFELFHWSLLFGLAACGAIYHGLKYGDDMTKGFGLTFLFINLYTRYFEWFWNSLHKAMFFALLGISFWYLGTKAETVWGAGRQDKSVA
jgi:hypothetical protein